MQFPDARVWHRRGKDAADDGNLSFSYDDKLPNTVEAQLFGRPIAVRVTAEDWAVARAAAKLPSIGRRMLFSFSRKKR
jgi:hypothetical protein